MGYLPAEPSRGLGSYRQFPLSPKKFLCNKFRSIEQLSSFDIRHQEIRTVRFLAKKLPEISENSSFLEKHPKTRCKNLLLRNQSAIHPDVPIRLEASKNHYCQTRDSQIGRHTREILLLKQAQKNRCKHQQAVISSTVIILNIERGTTGIFLPRYY